MTTDPEPPPEPPEPAEPVRWCAAYFKSTACTLPAHDPDVAHRGGGITWFTHRV